MTTISLKQKPLGFTIVELMIVIIVIAILAAITIVAYTNIQNRARASATQSDLAQIERSFDIYYLDNNAFPSSIEEIREAGLGGMVDKISYNDTTDVQRGMYNLYSRSWTQGARGHTADYWDYEEQQWVQRVIHYSADGEKSLSENSTYRHPGDYNSPCRTEYLDDCVSPPL